MLIKELGGSTRKQERYEGRERYKPGPRDPLEACPRRREVHTWPTRSSRGLSKEERAASSKRRRFLSLNPLPADPDVPPAAALGDIPPPPPLLLLAPMLLLMARLMSRRGLT